MRLPLLSCGGAAEGRIRSSPGPPPPPPPPPPAANAGMTDGAAISAIKKVPSVTNLTTDLIMRVSCVPARTLQPTYKPHAAQDIPEDFFGGGEWPRQIIASTASNPPPRTLPSPPPPRYRA